MTGVVDHEISLRPSPLLGSERIDWFWLVRDTVTHWPLHLSLSLIGAGNCAIAWQGSEFKGSKRCTLPAWAFRPASRAPCGLKPRLPPLLIMLLHQLEWPVRPYHLNKWLMTQIAPWVSLSPVFQRRHPGRARRVDLAAEASRPRRPSHAGSTCRAGAVRCRIRQGNPAQNGHREAGSHAHTIVRADVVRTRCRRMRVDSASEFLGVRS